jgi:hypothetical protein
MQAMVLLTRLGEHAFNLISELRMRRYELRWRAMHQRRSEQIYTPLGDTKTTTLYPHKLFAQWLVSMVLFRTSYATPLATFACKLSTHRSVTEVKKKRATIDSKYSNDCNNRPPINKIIWS